MPTIFIYIGPLTPKSSYLKIYTFLDCCLFFLCFRATSRHEPPPSRKERERGRKRDDQDIVSCNCSSSSSLPPSSSPPSSLPPSSSPSFISVYLPHFLLPAVFYATSSVCSFTTISFRRRRKPHIRTPTFSWRCMYIPHSISAPSILNLFCTAHIHSQQTLQLFFFSNPHLLCIFLPLYSITKTFALAIIYVKTKFPREKVLQCSWKTCFLVKKPKYLRKVLRS